MQSAAPVAAPQDLVTSLDPNAANWLEWAGLLLTDSSRASVVEAVLRCKALVLVAVALKKRTFR
jgi:hypothetical protein